MKRVNTYKAKVVIIGAGYAGLFIAYHLKKAGIDFLIVDRSRRIGDSWRNRYDSLKLLTPATHDQLPDYPLTGDPLSYPSKDVVANYLEKYVKHFKFPVITEMIVKELAYKDSHFIATTNKGVLISDAVVVATGPLQVPLTPNFNMRTPKIQQLHSSEYKSSKTIIGPDVLVVGSGHSGTQISAELSKKFNVTLSSNHNFIKSNKLDFAYQYIANLTSPKVTTFISKLLRLRKINPEFNQLLENQKITLKPRLVRISRNRFYFSDNTSSKFNTIIWATGFDVEYSWIKIPEAFRLDKTLLSDNGVAKPTGLYIVYPQRDLGFIQDLPQKAKYIVRHLLSIYG
jgi:putative flavoprotein involved in K+ transport